MSASVQPRSRFPLPKTPSRLEMHMNGSRFVDNPNYTSRRYAANRIHQRDEGIQVDNSNVIFIGGLDSSIPDTLVREVFGRFGQIISLARRKTNNSMNTSGDSEYAFMGFQTVQQAQFALQCRAVDAMGKRLVIKPRDRPRYQAERNGRTNLNQQTFYGSPPQQKQEYSRDRTITFREHAPEGGQILHPPPGFEAFGQNGGPHRAPRGPEEQSLHQQTRSSPQLLSKGLTVYNVPPDMSPGELYQIFGHKDAVEGCYIYQWPDNYGRRFGHIIMNTFFYAQKAVENLNGFSVRGHVLEVVYKKDNEPFWFQGSGALENHPNRSLTPPNQTLYTADGQPLTGEYPVPYPHHSTPSSVQASQSFVGTTPNMPQIYHTAPTNDYSQGYSGYQRNDNPPGRFPQGQLLNHIPHGSIQQNGFNSQHSVHYDQMHGQNYRPPNMPMGYGSQPTPQQFRQQPQNHGFTMPQRVIYPQAPQYYEYPHPAQQYSMNPMPYSGQFTNGYPAQMQPPQPNQFGIGQGYGVTSNPTMSNGSASTRRNSGDSQIFVPYNTEIPIPSSPAATNAVTEKSFIAEPIEVPPAEKPEDPCNLFVKNLPKDITDGDELKALFEKFGTIVSAHLPVYEGSNTPRGYGFVLFSTPEEARNALKEMNEKMLGNKRLFVHYYENKENRTKRLAVLFHGDVDIANAANATPEEDSADKILSEHELTATPTVNGPQSKASVNGNGPPTESAPTKYTQENVVVTPSADHGPVAIMFTPFETVPMGVRDMNKVTVASESGVPPIAKDEETVPFDNKNVTEIDRVSTNPSPNTHASLRRAQNPLPRIPEDEELVENTTRAIGIHTEKIKPLTEVTEDNTAKPDQSSSSLKTNIIPAVPSAVGRRKIQTHPSDPEQSHIPVSPKEDKNSHALVDSKAVECPTSDTITKAAPPSKPSNTGGSSRRNRKGKKAPKTSIAAAKQ